MKKYTHIYAAVILPVILLASTPAVSATQSGSVNEDLFLENVYEDYTLASGNFWSDNRPQSEFSALETGQQISDADVFLERVYEDYTLGE